MIEWRDLVAFDLITFAPSNLRTWFDPVTLSEYEELNSMDNHLIDTLYIGKDFIWSS